MSVKQGRHRRVPRMSIAVCTTSAVAVLLGSSIAARHAIARPIAPPEIDPSAVERFVNAYRARTGLPGAIVAITMGDRVIYTGGLGTSSDGTALGEQSRLPIASLSKSFVSLAIMQLVEAGQVDLDQPVRRYLPEFVVGDARGDAITVRQLLDHTSGMADTEFPEKSIPVPTSLRDGVARLRTARLASDPGASAHYHNPNYWVAARLIEVVSGESFSEYLRRHLFAPAGMNASTTVGSLAAAADVARGHIRLYGASVALPEPNWYLDGASGIVSTAHDLAQWLIVQNSGGVAANGTRLVSAKSIDQMRLQKLGWSRDTDTDTGAVHHTGWLFTFTAVQVVQPSTGYGLVVVTNRGLSLGPDDSAEIMSALVAMTRGEAPSMGAPVGRIVDLVLAMLTIVIGAAAVRSLRRSRAWAERWRRRRTVRAVLGPAAWIVPIAILAGLRRLLMVLFGGRDGTWTQITYLAPSLMVLLVVAASLGLANLIVRARYVVGA
jgi:CubicO group peptidase (beta-lactamase class C family)